MRILTKKLSVFVRQAVQLTVIYLAKTVPGVKLDF